MLKENGITVTLRKILAIELDNTPGMAADALQTFASDEMNVKYMYSFLLGGKGILVFRTDNFEKAQEIIKEKGFKEINDEDLSVLVKS